MDAESLQEIDRQLDAFGKTDEELARVRARAVGLARSLADDEGDLTELLEGASEALAVARQAAAADVAAASREAAPPRARPEPPPPPPPRVAPAPPSLPDSEAAAALDAEIVDAFGSEPPPLETSDIAGMSVDELFADADPSPSMPPQDLATLFDEEDELDASEPELGLNDLDDPDDSVDAATAEPAAAEAAPEAPVEAPAADGDRADDATAQVAAADAEPPSEAPTAPNIDDFPMFGEEEEDDATFVVSADDLEELSGDDFELLVDEEVLEMDADESEAAAEDDAVEGGLISRILSRK